MHNIPNASRRNIPSVSIELLRRIRCRRSGIPTTLTSFRVMALKRSRVDLNVRSVTQFFAPMSSSTEKLKIGPSLQPESLRINSQRVSASRKDPAGSDQLHKREKRLPPSPLTVSSSWGSRATARTWSGDHRQESEGTSLTKKNERKITDRNRAGESTRKQLVEPFTSVTDALRDAAGAHLLS